MYSLSEMLNAGTLRLHGEVLRELCARVDALGGKPSQTQNVKVADQLTYGLVSVNAVAKAEADAKDAKAHAQADAKDAKAPAQADAEDVKDTKDAKNTKAPAQAEAANDDSNEPVGIEPQMASADSDLPLMNWSGNKCTRMLGFAPTGDPKPTAKVGRVRSPIRPWIA